MSVYLASDKVVARTPDSWVRTTFRSISNMRKRANTSAQATLLSLSSDGTVKARSEQDGLGRQAPSAATVLSYWQVEPDDLVVNPMWLVGAGIGVSRVRGAVSPAYRVYSLDRSRVYPPFLHYLLRSSDYVAQYRILGRGDTTFDRSVGREDFEGLTISIPSLGYQRRIADFLDDQVARLDRATKLRQEQRTLIGQRPWIELVQSVREFARVPLRRFITFATDGPFGSAFGTSDYVSEGCLVIRLGNIGFGEFRDHESAFVSEALWRQFPRCHVREGDLLVASLGDPKNHPGRACVAPNLGRAMVKGKCFCVRLDMRTADPKYVSAVLSSPLGAELVGLSARGSTRSMINLEILRAVELPMPSLSEQSQVAATFAAEISATDATRRVLDTSLALLAERKRALITAAVTGEFDVSTARGVG